MSDLADWVIVRWEHIAPFTLRLYFADDTEQIINFEPVLRGPWLKSLRDPEYFKQVRLNEAGNLEWPEGQDFNPEALHDWPAFEHLYIEDGKRLEEAEKTLSKRVRNSAVPPKKKRERLMPTVS